MRRILPLHLLIALWAGLLLPATGVALDGPRIFVLHAYSQDYPWTHGQHHRFVDTLDQFVDVFGVEVSNSHHAEAAGDLDGPAVKGQRLGGDLGLLAQVLALVLLDPAGHA